MKKIRFAWLILPLLHSCIVLEETSLDLPEPEPVILDHCSVSSPGVIYMNIFGLIKSDFLPASLKIETDTLLIYADPVVFRDSLPADFIFITHNHYDHFSKKVIARLSGPETVVIGPKTVTKKLRRHKTITAVVGDELDFGRLQCKVVESYNLRSNLHQQGSNFVGYVLTVDSLRIYIPGDTDLIPEMESLENIDAAFLPIGEGTTAMDPEMAARAARIIHPRMVVPIHYEIGQGREEDFRKVLDTDITLRLFNAPPE